MGVLGESASPDTVPSHVLSLAGMVHVAIGTIGLFFAFLFAYGFRDEVAPGNHAFFVAALVAVATLSSVVVSTVLLGGGRSYLAALVLAGRLALVLYPLALGLGTVVSLLNEDRGSVTADQPDWPFVLLVAGGLLVSGVASAGLRRRLSA